MMTRSPEERFEAVVDALLDHPGVMPPQTGGSSSQFGSSGLKIGGKIFAMLVRGRLVLKLPRSRVDALVAAGEGERFDPRRDGRVMKQWLVLDPASQLERLPLASKAMQFVGGR